MRLCLIGHFLISIRPFIRFIFHHFLQKSPAADGLFHLFALLLEFQAEGVRPLGHAEELLLLQEGIIVPLGVVVIGEISLVFSQGIARETLVIADDVAKPFGAHHLSGKCLVRVIG